MHGGFLHFQLLFQHYGLAAVFAVLLLENFGLPLPGEVTLLYAGYHLRRSGAFGLPELILVASCASIAGQSIGFWIGARASHWLERWFRLTPERRAFVESYFRRYGPVTVLFARFIALLRILVAPVAGLYGMPAATFMLYNVIGAVAWVSAVGFAGSLLGAHSHQLWFWMGRFNLLLLGLALGFILVAAHRMRRRLASAP